MDCLKDHHNDSLAFFICTTPGFFKHRPCLNTARTSSSDSRLREVLLYPEHVMYSTLAVMSLISLTRISTKTTPAAQFPSPRCLSRVYIYSDSNTRTHTQRFSILCVCECVCVCVCEHARGEFIQIYRKFSSI